MRFVHALPNANISKTLIIHRILSARPLDFELFLHVRGVNGNKMAHRDLFVRDRDRDGDVTSQVRPDYATGGF